MLTQKQRDLLILIHERMAKDGVAPSFDEMREELGLKSKSGIHRLIGVLEERGFLERLPNKARALLVRKLPEGYIPQDWDCSDVAQKTRAAQQAALKPSSTVVAMPSPSDDSSIVDVPLCGKIAAGTPIEAISHPDDFIPFPASMLGRGGDHYALTIDGDSMIDAGINDGDTVLIRRSSAANDGDIVVALIDDQEATLKELRRRGAHYDLVPRNRAHEIRTFEAPRVQVQGVLAGLYRQY